MIAHENALLGLLDLGATGESLPRDTFFGASKQIRFNDEPIEIIHLPAGHTDGDVMVYFRKSDVLSVGDVLTSLDYPVIRPEEGGSLNGVIDALNRVIDITVADWRQQGGTYVVPGHGRVHDETDVVNYRDVLAIIRDRVQDGIEKGMTLEQVRAARPSMEFDVRYGRSTEPWTTDMFIEAVYENLTAQRAGD